jgi:hypothetical protein
MANKEKITIEISGLAYLERVEYVLVSVSAIFLASLSFLSIRLRMEIKILPNIKQNSKTPMIIAHEVVIVLTSMLKER